MQTVPPDVLSDLLRALVFAAERHRQQSRKDELKTPYVNHLLEVVQVLVDHGVRDAPTLMAAALHDTVEDTGTTLEEIADRFGPEVRDLVAEMTDDKRLPRDERKRLQVEHAAAMSPRGALIKLADKIANAWDVGHRPAAAWPPERRLGYLAWALAVVEALPPVAPGMVAVFRRVHAESVQLVERGG